MYSLSSLGDWKQSCIVIGLFSLFGLYGFPYALSSDRQRNGRSGQHSVPVKVLLTQIFWPMLLAKSSVHLRGSFQGPQITGQFMKCWPDLLHGFLAAYGGVGFAFLVFISCYNL